jgi:hypothetical protein
MNYGAGKFRRQPSHRDFDPVFMRIEQGRRIAYCNTPWNVRLAECAAMRGQDGGLNGIICIVYHLSFGCIFMQWCSDNQRFLRGSSV